MQIMKLSGKMPIIDSFKTAGVIGLLMQQTVAVYDVDMKKNSQTQERCVSSCGYERGNSISSVEDALSYIEEMTAHFSKAYRALANAPEEAIAPSVQALKIVRPDLIEQQLRALHGLAMAAYKDASEQRKAELKPLVLIVAKARSAASDLNDLIRQMTVPVNVYKSNIDKHALSELAKHGTSVFHSSQFH